jgi:hypothetical protein
MGTEKGKEGCGRGLGRAGWVGACWQPRLSRSFVA